MKGRSHCISSRGISYLGVSFLGALVLGIIPAARGQEIELPLVVSKPRLSFGGGVLAYREHDFDTAPGLKSSFREPFFETGLGWDFIVAGHNVFNLGLDFWQSAEGTEKWKDSDIPVQENDLDVDRFSLTLGYLASSWNRALPPTELPPASRIFRIGGGLNFYYRRQAFFRDDFEDLTTNPPTFIDAEVEEVFDMVGGEVVLDMELGPRHIACAFLRLKSGGGWVGVTNDGLEPLVDEDDSDLSTAGIHGTVEAGVVSQPTPQVELRLGYRFHWTEVFQEQETVSGFDPVLGPVTVSIELPDNSTEIHMVFFEAAFPF